MTMFSKHISDVEKIMATEDGAKGAGLRWLLGPADNMPNFSMRMVEVDPEGMTMHHSHDYEHVTYTVEGQGELIDEQGNSMPLTPGVAAYVAPNSVHQFRNTGTGMFKFICVIPRIDLR